MISNAIAFVLNAHLNGKLCRHAQINLQISKDKLLSFYHHACCMYNKYMVDLHSMR